MNDTKDDASEEPTERHAAAPGRESSSTSGSGKAAATRASGRAYHHGNLHQALIDAAIDLIGEEGAAGFQLRAVARRAGVSPAAPYRHFRDKADLLNAVASQVAQRLVEVTEKELEKVKDEPSIMQFRAQGVAFVKFAVAHPAHFRVMNLPEVAGRFDDKIQALNGGRNILEEAILASREVGEITESQATVSLAARSMVYGLARLMVDGHLGAELPTEEEAEQAALAVTALLGVGIIPRG